VLAYTAHYYLAIYEAKLYHTAASRVVTCEGHYETSAGVRQPIGWRLIWVTLTLSTFTAIVWWVALQQLQRPDVLSFLMGGWLLLLSMLIVRQLRQISLFRYWRSTGGIKGTVRLSERLIIVTSSTEYQVYAAFFLFLVLVTGDLFFLGGAFTCFAAGRHRRDSGIVLDEAYPHSTIGGNYTK
jgi:hypothetical protein